jgi:two-component system invasion response regulator UvrY
MAHDIRVLIADDHPLIVEGLRLLLPALGGIEVVATATTTADLLTQVRRTKPDVCVLDVRFGEQLTGLDILKTLAMEDGAVRVVFYSQFDQDEIIREAYRLGAKGFVTKAKPPASIAEAVRHAHAGKTHFLPEIAERLALLGVRGDESPQTKLEPRELEVFRLMAQGLTNVEIAERLDLSPKTISMTSQTIKDKLGMHRPAELALLAVKHNLVQP